MERREKGLPWKHEGHPVENPLHIPARDQLLSSLEIKWDFLPRLFLEDIAGAIIQGRSHAAGYTMTREVYDAAKDAREKLRPYPEAPELAEAVNQLTVFLKRWKWTQDDLAGMDSAENFADKFVIVATARVVNKWWKGIKPEVQGRFWKESRYRLTGTQCRDLLTARIIPWEALQRPFPTRDSIKTAEKVKQIIHRSHLHKWFDEYEDSLKRQGKKSVDVTIPLDGLLVPWWQVPKPLPPGTVRKAKKEADKLVRKLNIKD